MIAAALALASAVVHWRELPAEQPAWAVSGVRVTGAWRLDSDHPGFGGFSGLALANGTIAMLSDKGTVFRLAALPSPSATAEVEAVPASCMSDDGDAMDAEALALMPDRTTLAFGLEREHGLCIGGHRTVPAAMQRWPRNRGAEAIAVSEAGMIVIGEDRQADGTYPLLRFTVSGNAIAGTPAEMRYRAPGGYKPADAAFLPDGRLLVINRRFGVRSGRGTVLTIVPAFRSEAGLTVQGVQSMRMARQPLAANFEGVAVEARCDIAVAWLISDDNFENPRGTVLVRLELPGTQGVQGIGREPCLKE